jgi:hypothetical protein
MKKLLKLIDEYWVFVFIGVLPHPRVLGGCGLGIWEWFGAITFLVIVAQIYINARRR